MASQEIVQCTFKLDVRMWNEYKQVCTESHINAVPYLLDLLERQLPEMEQQLPNKPLEKRKVLEKNYFYLVAGRYLNDEEAKQQVKNIKIPFPKNIYDKFQEVVSKKSYSRNILLSETIRLALYGAPYIEDQNYMDIDDLLEWHFQREHVTNYALFSPLRLAHTGLKKPHLFRTLFGNEGTTLEGYDVPAIQDWYKTWGEMFR